jgi:ABC-type multidrug transport system fused ATPase/permease subunit
MKDQVVRNIYLQEKDKHEKERAKFKKRRSLLGWSRLAVIILTGVICFYSFSSSIFIGIIVIVTGISIFLIVVSLDLDNDRKIANLQLLIQINEQEIASLEGKFDSAFDGINFLPALHNYAMDLDVFGNHSLYQLVNRANTEQGRRLIANNFLAPLPVDEISNRHEAIKELSPIYQWRQQLQAYSLAASIKESTQTKIENWIQEEKIPFEKSIWQPLVILYSAISVTTAIFAIAGYISSSAFVGLFIFYLIISYSLGRRAGRVNVYLSGVVSEVSVIQQLIKWVEEKEFSSALLQELQNSVKENGKKAHLAIQQLRKILDRFDLRLNVLVHVFLNSFLLWDVRQLISLNKWKKANGSKISQWYQLIAQFEVLNSLSTVHFNYPDWAIPKFVSEHFTLESRDLGHPLIYSEHRVNSDFSLKGQSKVALITGSNMAGKSTFLRNLGVNIILAQMGAPVCATSFTLSPNKLMSSMRISDNLAESTSTFYAELKKLKTIIEAVNRNEQIFILLDEILRGTNSLDKHSGSEALIRQLIKQKAVAVLATHDVELSNLEKEFPGSLENYHFDVQVQGEELYFDYKLKQGVCTSLNASILMKKIGIEI